MICFGFGEMCGALFIGIIIDKYHNKTASLVNIILVVISSALVVLYIKIDKYGILSFIMPFLWGFADSATNT
jgi:predicted MFS family arabinose efflux permease